MLAVRPERVISCEVTRADEPGIARAPAAGVDDTVQTGVSVEYHPFDSDASFVFHSIFADVEEMFSASTFEITGAAVSGVVVGIEDPELHAPTRSP